jgi:hypothetical protein
MLSLSKFEPENPGEHFTITIHSPWSEGAFCKYMFPEWAFAAMSEFCLLGYIGRDASHLQPREFPQMRISPEGSSASYALDYPSGVSFGASAVVTSPDTVEMEVKVTNRSKRFFPGVDFAACLNLIPMGEEFASIDHSLKVFTGEKDMLSFNDLHYAGGSAVPESERTYARISVKGTPGVYEQSWSNGVWRRSCRLILEKAGMPFIARKSATTDRFVAVFWPKARYVMSNSGLACIHADPTVPNCPGGEEVALHGRIIFHEGDAGSLRRRIEGELAELSRKDRVWKHWHV